MKAQIFINGVIGVDCTLLDVIRQVKSYKNPTEVYVEISSVGGSVGAGQSIFQYLRNLNLPITTVAEKAYSIASVIFMAGDTRIVPEGERRLMIHNPWATVEGGADSLEKVASQLREIEDEFTNFYSSYSSIDKESIKTLLKNETFLSGNEAVQMGFATELSIPLKAVALIGDSLEDEEIKKEIKMNKAEKFYSELKKLFTIMEKTDFKALIVQDANGVEINFTEVEEGVEPQVGDVATVDDAPAEGDYTAPNGDLWVFEAGVLKEVKPFEAPVDEPTEEPTDVVETQDLVARLEQLEKGMAAMEAKYSERDAEVVALKASFEAMKGTNDELVSIKAELKALKELVGSEEANIQAKETKTNQKKSGGLINMFK